MVKKNEHWLLLWEPSCIPSWLIKNGPPKRADSGIRRRLQIFLVDLGHALQFFDVLGHAGVFVVEVVAAGELVEAGLGVLALLDLQVPAVGHAGACGDQAAQDDVLLETAQVVHAAFQRGLGEEDAGGLLEAGGRDETFRRQGGLGDAQQQGLAGGGLATILEGLLVDLLEAVLVDLLLDDELRVAHVGDEDPAHHLADDHLDVLVVDDHTLGPVDLLDLIDEEGLEGPIAPNLKKIMGA